MSNEEKDLAFVDGQNLHLGTKEDGWNTDHQKFRIYLRDKYKVREAYYFMGCISETEQDLYNSLQKAGFIVVFKEHTNLQKTKKKGNVDADIVFEIMKNLVDSRFDKVVLVSGDGDYKKIVDYLVKKKKFKKILFPNQKFASSLYKVLGSEYFDYLVTPDIKAKIQYIK